MAISEHESGTKNFSGDVNDTFDTIQTTTPETTDGIYQFLVDLTNMVAGDIVSIRIKEKVKSGGTAAVIFSTEIAGAQAEPAWVSPSLILLHGWDFQMRQRTGTGRSLDWSIRKVA